MTSERIRRIEAKAMETEGSVTIKEAQVVPKSP
jgi:hypothetical protein